MKRIIPIVISLMFLTLASCSKKEEPVIPGQLPSWVKHKVADLTANGQPCSSVFILYFEVDGRKYYNIDFAYSDCAFCNVFDEKGRAVPQAQQANWGDRKVLEGYTGCQ